MEPHTSVIEISRRGSNKIWLTSTYIRMYGSMFVVAYSFGIGGYHRVWELNEGMKLGWKRAHKDKHNNIHHTQHTVLVESDNTKNGSIL